MKKVFNVETIAVVQNGELVDSLENENELYPAVDYNYLKLNLDEIAVYAQQSREAMNECLVRIHPLVLEFSRKVYRVNSGLVYDDMYVQLIHTAEKAIMIYDPKRGKFINLLRHMLLISQTNEMRKQILRRARKIHHLGRRVWNLSEEDRMFYDSLHADDETAAIRAKLDLEMYLKSLPFDWREIFEYYIEGFGIAEISKMVQLCYSTVSYRIKRMMEQFYKMENK